MIPDCLLNIASSKRCLKFMDNSKVLKNIFMYVWERSSISKMSNLGSSKFDSKESYHTIDEMESLFEWKDCWGST